jgi:hypothetical protein
MSIDPKFAVTRKVKVLFRITTNPGFTKLCRHTVPLLGFPIDDGQDFSWNWRSFFRNPVAMVRCVLVGKCQWEGRTDGRQIGPVSDPGPRERVHRGAVLMHLTCLDDATLEAAERVMSALGRGLSVRAIAGLGLPSALERFGLPPNRGSLTMALKLVPGLFLSSLPRLVPGFNRAGMELIGDGTTSLDGTSSYYAQHMQMTLLSGRQIRGVLSLRRNPKQYAQVPGSDVIQNAGRSEALASSGRLDASGGCDGGSA